MKLNNLLASFLLTSAALAASTVLGAEDWDIRGEARAIDNGDVLYVEKHFLTRSNGEISERLVEYYRPNGDLFASKRLRYDTDYRYVPRLDWEDLEEEIEITGRLSNSRYTQRIQGPDRDEEETASLPDSDRVAFDAAFDQYLVDNMEQLLDEGRLEFEFLSLSAGRTYAFRAEVESESDTEVAVRVGPRNAVIRLFVDPITLTYDLEQNRLTRFVGVTNFRRDGDLVSADIRYEYADRNSSEGD